MGRGRLFLQPRFPGPYTSRSEIVPELSRLIGLFPSGDVVETGLLSQPFYQSSFKGRLQAGFSLCFLGIDFGLGLPQLIGCGVCGAKGFFAHGVGQPQIYMPNRRNCVERSFPQPEQSVRYARQANSSATIVSDSRYSSSLSILFYAPRHVTPHLWVHKPIPFSEFNLMWRTQSGSGGCSEKIAERYTHVFDLIPQWHMKHGGLEIAPLLVQDDFQSLPQRSGAARACFVSVGSRRAMCLPFGGASDLCDAEGHLVSRSGAWVRKP